VLISLGVIGACTPLNRILPRADGSTPSDTGGGPPDAPRGDGATVFDAGTDAGAADRSGAGGSGAGGLDGGSADRNAGMGGVGMGGAGMGGAGMGGAGMGGAGMGGAGGAGVDAGTDAPVLPPARLAFSVPAGNLANFGTVNVGTPKNQVFVVTNTGQQASTAITLSLSSVVHFAVLAPTTGDCVSGTTTLAAGAFCNVRVSFPGATGGGTTSATLTAAATAGGMATLVLSGIAHKFQTVVMAPAPGSSVDFGTVIIGAAPKTQTYIVTNTGDDPADPVGIAIFPTDSAYSYTNAVGDCMGGVTALAAGASCPVHVVLAPGPRAGP
jgi:hypothetical protein